MFKYCPGPWKVLYIIPISLKIKRVLAFRTLTRQDLVDYINSHFKAPRMVLAAAGGGWAPA